ncbi:MAG: hypothetical protein Ta2A_01420 [Treponemataceae bacterium]|nr:MAG: hypothetical protein Ta2A_01420 [Treponemataceae bacterium]
MLIKLTKKLSDELDLKLVPVTENVAFFSWHANLLTVNRRKTILLVNDATKISITLFGVRAKDYGQLTDLIISSIREVFALAGINENQIEQYFSGAGAITYAKADRSMLAQMAQLQRDIFYRKDKFDPSKINQTLVSKKFMDDPVSSLGYEFPVEVLGEYFKKMENGENLQDEKPAVVLKKAFRFTIVLCDDAALPIWREVIVDANITFRKFHRIIQKLFSWKNCHLHDFTILKNTEMPGEFGEEELGIEEFRKMEFVRISDDYCENFYDYNIMAFSPYGDGSMLPPPVPAAAETAKLSKYFGEYKNCIYTYDYGDGWRHRITLKNVLEDYELDAPRCIMGEGNAPPEDCGGIGGYADMLRVMAGGKLSYDKDATKEDYKSVREWIACTEFEEFNIDAINKRLEKLR